MGRGLCNRRYADNPTEFACDRMPVHEKLMELARSADWVLEALSVVPSYVRRGVLEPAPFVRSLARMELAS